MGADRFPKRTVIKFRSSVISVIKKTWTLILLISLILLFLSVFIYVHLCNQCPISEIAIALLLLFDIHILFVTIPSMNFVNQLPRRFRRRQITMSGFWG